MNSQQLFRRSRIHLACWYAGTMGGILMLLGLSMYRALIQTNWNALEREIESLAGTLHDSLEPMLPATQDPTLALQQIFPDLCLVQRPCNQNYTVIERHTIGISDRNIYYIRLFNYHGQLLAFSPNQPLPFPRRLNPNPWQTFRAANGTRYHQFTIILHSANTHPKTQTRHNHNHPSWGYLQIGRNLATFDAETKRIQWILTIGFPLSLGLIVASSWGLSGLAMQPIYQSYQQQQQFTANAAHELRSPLASLLATVEAILRLAPEQQQHIPPMLETIKRQGRRLSDLIANLLLLTSLEQNSSPKPFKTCCLNDLIADLTEEFLELATVSDIHLSSQVPNWEIYVLGNESQLYRLVSNLIANAIQYTSAGGSVIVSLECCTRTAMIAIKDTGIGIPLAEQRRIFERFYRVDGARSRQSGGTGLGLAIARAITHLHQGHITVKSDVGEGSLFTIQLPRVN